MNEEIPKILTELEKISLDSKEKFAHLSAVQFNWKPSAESWSVGQCFAHLVKTNESFFPILDDIAQGKRKNSLWENYSPLTKFFGRRVVGALKSTTRKFPAPKDIRPSESAIELSVIDEFIEQQREVAAKIKATENLDWQKIVLTSPFFGLITYNLRDGYKVFVTHAQRHLRQAENVMQAEEFPKN